MSNHFFSFQQFTVRQENCAMKVTTEASLFGAWVSDLLSGKNGTALDIGTGTGLLSLIMAQETSLQIDAIEIEAAAAAQANENFSSSPFTNRLKIIHADVQSFASANKYDFIFSNPPFYEHDLSSPHPGKQKAHHGESLKLSSLCKKIKELLNEEGVFFILFPSQRKEALLNELKKVGLYAVDIVHVFNGRNEKPFRIFVKGSRKESSLKEAKLFIREEEGGFTEDFRKLMAPYYLPQALQQNRKDIRIGE